MWTQPMIAFSGVRSSCESTAMKSSLVRLWRSASPRAACSRSSTSRAALLQLEALRDVDGDRHAHARLDVRRHAPLQVHQAAVGRPAAGTRRARRGAVARAWPTVCAARSRASRAARSRPARWPSSVVARAPQQSQHGGVGVGEAAAARRAARCRSAPGRRWRGSAARCGACRSSAMRARISACSVATSTAGSTGCTR